MLVQYASSLADVYAAAKVAAHYHEFSTSRYLEIVSKNGQGFNSDPELPRGQNSPIIWFRGHEQSSWNLEPSLLREKHPVGYPPSKSWSPSYKQARLQESYRLQYFSARAYHIIPEKPYNNIEWQEIMQHYWVNTRLMDWSENINVALLFALEPFIANPDDDTFKFRRINADPTIWLYNPALSNAMLFDLMVDKRAIIESAVSILFSETYSEEMDKAVDAIYSYMVNNRDSILDAHEFRGSGIVSLSRIAELRASASINLLQMLITGEFNPFYYILLRIYSDGISLNIDLPPLAMIHPYHSARIATQKGAFTVFPFPKDKPKPKDESEASVIPLNKYPGWDNCLCEIRLIDPQSIANEMARLGYSREDLYPELETFGRETERRQVLTFDSGLCI